MMDLPEVYRYGVSEAGRTRLLAGGLTVHAVCLCVYLAVTRTPAGSSPFFYALLGLQAMVLLIYGAQRAASCISKERTDRTWDLQRQTPLTSLELTAGKLLGAPIYAYFLAGVSAPWLLVCVFTGPGLGRMASAYGLLAALVFLTLNLALLASAYTEGRDSGSVNTGGAVLGFFALQMVTAIVSWNDRVPAIPFYGARAPADLFLMGSGAAFGAWAFAAAMWRVGRDLLERGRAWRLPSFLLFLAFYINGLVGENRILAGNMALIALIAPAFFVYGAAFLEPARLDHWRRWLSSAPKERLDRTPGWLVGWAALVLIAFCLGAGRYPWISVRLLILIPAFIGRDLAFVQWCRFTDSRRPELMALCYLALVYCLPPMLLGAFQAPQHLCLFMPYHASDLSALRNALPALLELAGMGALMLARFDRKGQ